MDSYDYNNRKQEWEEELEGVEDFGDKLARHIYTTYDYYMTGFNNVKHGFLILNFKGEIIDVNPFFCAKLGYLREELISKNIKMFSVNNDNLCDSDSINILTLLTNTTIQATNQCNLKNKEQKLFRCRWVCNRIPVSLDNPFSHSIVHVYFLNEVNYEKIVETVSKIDKKESSLLYRLLDSTGGKIIVVIILILIAISGNLPKILEHFL